MDISFVPLGSRGRHMKGIDSTTITDKISKKLINIDFTPGYHGDSQGYLSNRQLLFEQYKLLVDSAHKNEERRGNSNNIFIGINTVLVSILIQIHPDQLSKAEINYIPPLSFLILIGILISWEWLKVIASYKRLNSLNYSLIENFETYLPTYVFSLRGKMETEEDDLKRSSRANVILIRENLLPKAFLLIYSIYFVTVMIIFFINLSAYFNQSSQQEHHFSKSSSADYQIVGLWTKCASGKHFF
jgi:hypothetical protein